jgi:hypothetical protein
MNRICPSCQSPMDLQQTACPSCGYAMDQLPTTVCHSVVRPPERRIPVYVQTAVQLDRTASSLGFERGIHVSFEAYLQTLTDQVSEVKVWVGSHGDLDEGQEHMMHLEEGTPEQALSEVKSIVFDGGGDPPEHHLDGIATMVQRVPWSHDALTRKTMIVFANAETKPARCGMTADEIGSQIRSMGILFYLVCEPTSALEGLALSANGLIVPISNDPDIEELQRATARVSRSLTATIASGGTVPMTITYPPPAPGSPGSFLLCLGAPQKFHARKDPSHASSANS